MSGIVLRCPNCGTTKAAPGECEACHEAQVRYFCTNHTPGRWLDAGACPQCGARFGESTRPAVARPVAARPPAAGSTATPVRPAAPTPDATSAPKPAVPPPRRSVESGESWGRRPRPPIGEHPASGYEHAASRTRPDPREAMHIPMELPVVRRRGGCLMRTLLIAAFLFIAFLSLFSGLGGLLLQLFFGLAF